MNESLDISNILKQIRDNKALDVNFCLNLDKISTTQTNRLFEFLRKTESVKTLDLGCNSLQSSEERFKQLCSVIENNKSITTIKLYGNLFTASQLVLIAKALVKNITVSELIYEAADTDIQPNVIQIIDHCLERNRNIATLNRYLSNNTSAPKDFDKRLLNNTNSLFKKSSDDNENAFRVGEMEEESIDIEALKERNQFIGQVLERYYLPELEKNGASHSFQNK